MKRILLLFTILLTSQFTSFSQDVISRVVGVSPFQDSLWVIDTTNYTVTHRSGPTPSSGGTITGMNGMAKRPSTGQIYTINKQSGTSGRTLGTLDLNTGVVTIIGNLGDNFSSITFRGDSLFGVTGDGAAVPETVYLINITDASKTLYRTLGNGADGEIICYNPSDDMIYHWSGNGTIVFEKFSPLLPADPVINIPIIGSTNGETFGSAYIGNNNFLNSNISSSFNHWNANGTVSSPSGSNPDDLRGLVFTTCTREVTGASGFCTGSSTVLTMSPGLSYQWFKDGVAISGQVFDTLLVSAPGIYNCIVHDVCGTDSVSVGHEVQEHNLPNVGLSGPTVFCTGTTITLTGSSGGTSQWYLNGAAISGETTNTIVVGTPGVYNMTKTNLNGCTDSSSVGITVVEASLPTVTLDPVADLCFGTPVVSLNGLPAGGTYSPSSDVDPMSLSPGTYGYEYVYVDTNGCTDTASISVNILDLPVVSMNAPSTDYCVYDASVTLTGTPSGGTFAGPGVSGSSFDPQTAGVGTHGLDYTYTDITTGCTNFDNMMITVDSCLSVNENQNVAISLYPNPANDNLTIQSTAKMNGLAVLDMTGKRIELAVVLQNNSGSFSVQSLESGAYWVVITLEDATRIEKLIVTH